MILNRMHGPLRAGYWALILCNIMIPQSLWFQRVRASVPALFVVSLVVNIGMWLERYVIVVISLHRDFIPSAGGCIPRRVGTSQRSRHDRFVPDACFICLSGSCP